MVNISHDIQQKSFLIVHCIFYIFTTMLFIVFIYIWIVLRWYLPNSEGAEGIWEEHFQQNTPNW